MDGSMGKAAGGLGTRITSFDRRLTCTHLANIFGGLIDWLQTAWLFLTSSHVLLDG